MTKYTTRETQKDLKSMMWVTNFLTQYFVDEQIKNVYHLCILYIFSWEIREESCLLETMSNEKLSLRL